MIRSLNRHVIAGCEERQKQEYWSKSGLHLIDKTILIVLGLVCECGCACVHIFVKMRLFTYVNTSHLQHSSINKSFCDVYRKGINT